MMRLKTLRRKSKMARKSSRIKRSNRRDSTSNSKGFSMRRQSSMMI